MAASRNMTEDFSNCYACDAPATSREHVPPLCIFPDGRDSNGKNLRRNLITVPSCEEHNLKKSKDDEFLMISVAGIFGNNSIGFRHKLGKVDRAIRRSSGKLLNSVFTERKHFVLDKIKANEFIEVIWGTPDHERLVRCCASIAQGIYYHEFEHRFSGRLQILLGHLRYSDPNSAQFVRFIKDRVDLELSNKPRRGDNQDAFFYQITDPDHLGLLTMRLCFYGGIEIYIALIPKGIEPPANLGAELIIKGVKTILRLGDRTYEFN